MEIFTKEPVLVTLDLNKKIRMEVDVLDYTIGGVLSMEYEDRKWRPVLWHILDTQGPMISLTSKPQRRNIMWEFTRELDKKPLLN